MPWSSRFAIAFILMICAIIIGSAFVHPVYGRDPDGRYAASPLKGWFDGLHSGKGPCCSDADGTALKDVDWEADGSRYRVRIEGEWFLVPPEAVLEGPNRAGVTMVWPIYKRDGAKLTGVEIRCFIPGTMT